MNRWMCLTRGTTEQMARYMHILSVAFHHNNIIMVRVRQKPIRASVWPRGRRAYPPESESSQPLTFHNVPAKLNKRYTPVV